MLYEDGMGTCSCSVDHARVIFSRTVRSFAASCLGPALERHTSFSPQEIFRLYAFSCCMQVQTLYSSKANS